MNNVNAAINDLETTEIISLETTEFISKETRAIMTPQTTHSYSKSYGVIYSENSSWINFYIGEPAQRDGEVDTIGHEVSYSHTLSGSLAAEIKDAVQLELGYSFGKSESFSVERSSAELKKGEYVKGYYAKTWSVTPVYQVDSKHTTGWQLIPGSGGEYEYVDYYETDRTTAYARRAIAPKLRLDYFSSTTRSGGCIKTEIYEYIDGNYQLLYTTNGYTE